jgi:signal transduction histidine kinase/DNA-binding response OmpR family regulator
VTEDDVARLRRRLEHLEFLRQVRRITNEATDADEAFQDVLDAIGEFTGWPVGHVYRWDFEEEVLVPGDAWWFTDPSNHRPLREATEDLTFPPGEGVPGRALDAREARRASPVTDLPDEPRADLAADLDLPVVYAIPVETEGRGAVLEFFTDAVEADEELLETLLEASTALQPVVERIRHRQDLEEAKEEAEAARGAAEAASRAKSQFLANMSHEIRTPMNAIIGMSSLMDEEALEPEEAARVETIRSSSDHLLALINDILDFSEIQADMLEIEESPFDLRGVVEDAMDLATSQAAEKDIDLAYIIEEEVPEGLVGDGNRIRQVLVNLLANGVKFTDEGYVRVRVAEVREREDDIVVGFEVEDTGPGIPEEGRESLFDAFTQADASTTREHGGTGLGLAVVSELVDHMGGALDIDSTVGEGTTVRFVVPLEEADEVPQRGWRESADLGELTMLVVDDEPPNREVLGQYLSEWGVESEIATDGPSALEALDRREEPPDAVLLDVAMPGMDGIEVARRIRSDPDLEDLPLVMLTSATEVRARLEEAEVEADVVLSKPLKPNQVYNGLVHVLDLETEGEAEPASGDGEPDLARRHPLDLLVAEDNPVNRRVLLEVLEGAGYEPRVAEDGREAVEAVLESPPDLVLMDVEMPEMDGIDATERIRAELAERDQPRIVALTAHVEASIREATEEAGMDDYVAKPVDPEDIVEIVRDTPAIEAG